MEVYILNSLNQRQTTVDDFVSLIWTERFAAYGDVQIIVTPTQKNRSLFQKGTSLAINQSKYVMTIETIEDDTDDDGQELLKITGYSLEYLMTRRVARGSFNNTTVEPQWVLTGTPVEVATQMFHDICVSGILDPGDVVPNIIEGSISPADTIVPPSDIITYSVDPKTLYDAMTTLCNTYLLGFRILRNGDSPQLYFDVYSGSDRTTHQTALPSVLFDVNLENLHNTSELSSTAIYMNTAYVISPVGFEIVYELNVPQPITGFDRRVILVNADDISDADPAVASAKMTQRGYEALAQNRPVIAFDGEVSQDGKYVYGKDYNLGDVVSLRSVDGETNDVQVTEQIFASDDQGDRSYPTLTINQLITPGSWLAVPPDQVWEDLDSDTTDVWENQP